MTGRVSNVTTFGAFVDIGVEHDAFVHIQYFPRAGAAPRHNQFNMKSTTGLRLGDRIKAVVDDVQPAKQRVSLRDVRFLTL